MKGKFIKKLKRSWLAVWIAFAAAALSTVGVLAAYTSVSSVKRVVSTQKGAGMLFSSNYLTTDENDLPRTITFSSMETSPCVTVNVCNYPQTMIKHNDKDITYIDCHTRRGFHTAKCYRPWKIIFICCKII